MDLKTLVAFFIGFIVLVTLGITTVLISSTFDDTGIAVSAETGGLSNATTNIAVDETNLAYPTPLQDTIRYTSCALSGLVVTNATSGNVITSTNYTTTGCAIKSTATASFNGSKWNVTGTYTYSYNRATDLDGNYSKGVTTFFDNTPTIFTILFIVILVGILGIIIYYANRFGSAGGL